MHDSADEMSPPKFCLLPLTIRYGSGFGYDVQVPPSARGNAWNMPPSPPGILQPSTFAPT